jgi:ATP-dependent DNA helicase RecG
MKAMDAFVRKLIEAGENSRIKYFADYRRDELAKAIRSFLDADGGWILLGYDGGKFTNVAVDPAELEKSVNGDFPRSLIYVGRKEHQGTCLYLIGVLKETEFDALPTPCDFPSEWEKSVAADFFFPDLRIGEILNVIEDCRKNRPEENVPGEVTDFLSRFDLLAGNEMTNATVLLFSKNSPLKCTVEEFSDDGIPVDTHVVAGNLFDIFRGLQPFVETRFLPKLDGDIRNMFIPAFNEALLNALIHADYSCATNVNLRIRSEKLEIINRGEMVPNIVANGNKIVGHVSLLRNPVIATIFYLRGLVSKRGSGLASIADVFRKANLQPPAWKSENGTTALTFSSASKDSDLNVRIIRFLERKKAGDDFSRNDYEDFYNREISEKTARNDIAKMFDDGFVNRNAKGPATKYIRTNKKLPPLI